MNRLSSSPLRFLPLCALLVLALLCTACGRSAPTSYYLLHSDEKPLTADRLPATTLRIAPVSIPAYLDRQSIVTRQPDNPRLRVDSFAVWAEPLDQGIRRVLREVLGARLLPDGITVDSGTGSDGWSTLLVLEVLRLDGAPGQTAHLEARWSVQDVAGTILARGNHADSLECRAGDSDGTAALVDAQSLLLQRLGQALAPQIARVASPAARGRLASAQ